MRHTTRCDEDLHGSELGPVHLQEYCLAMMHSNLMVNSIGAFCCTPFWRVNFSSIVHKSASTLSTSRVGTGVFVVAAKVILGPEFGHFATMYITYTPTTHT